MKWKLFIIIFSLIYIFVTLFSVYRLYNISNHRDGGKRSSSAGNQDNTIKPNNNQKSSTRRKYTELKIVEIWSKAAIGLYLWKHILNGEVEDLNAGLIQQGNLETQNIRFIFRSGPGVIPTTVPNDIEYLTLVLNGRSDEKIRAARLWLDYLPSYSSLKRVAVVLLGDEKCYNDWLLNYMKSNGGQIDLVFMVYDSPLVDNEEFYQWPLGVAVYRGFPNVSPDQVDLASMRSHLCNFVGTIYNDSSRLDLGSQLDNLHDQCIVLGRKKWIPLETAASLNTYMKALLTSDLTLSPVGMNTECYRIYEAMSLGSVPVIEDNLTPGKCGTSETSPLRLLKSHDAPVMYIKDWKELPLLLNEEGLLTLEEKVERRIAVIEWYKNFKGTMANLFVSVIQRKFF